MRALPLLTVLLVVAAPMAQANDLVNGDFESPSILGSGQTEVALGQTKSTTLDPTDASYAGSISGIRNWTYGLDRADGSGYGTDLGITNGRDFGDGDPSRKLFVNRWARNVVQSPVADVLTAGFTYTLTARSYMVLDHDTDYKAGTLNLYAGRYVNGDPNQFGGVPLLGVSHMVSQAAANLFTGPNDHVTLAGHYYDHAISYTVSSGDANIGKPLSAVVLTEAGSAGPTYWDRVSLTVTPVPEPGAFAALGFGALAIVRRRRGVRAGT